MKIALAAITLGLIISSLGVVSSAVAEENYQTFTVVNLPRFNDSYIEGKGFSAGNFRAGVIWSNESLPGTIMMIVNHQRSYGVAEVEAKNGTKTIPLLSQSFLFLQFMELAEVTGEQPKEFHLVKSVPLNNVSWVIATEKTEVSDTFSELVLEANASLSVPGATEPTILTLRFHAFINQTIIEDYTVNKYHVSVDDNGKIQVKKTVDTMDVPVSIIGVKFKVDHEIYGWPSESSANKFLLTFKFGIAQYWPLYVERVLRAFARQQMEMREGEDHEIGDNETLKKPMRFRDASKIPTVFGWIPTAEVDGEETNVSVIMRRPQLDNTVVKSWNSNNRLHVKTLRTKGAFVYQSGSTIIHDPDIQTLSITPLLDGLTTKSNQGGFLSYEFLFIVGSLLLIPLAMKKHKNF